MRARITATANQLHIKSGLQVVRTRQDAEKTQKKRKEKKRIKARAPPTEHQLFKGFPPDRNNEGDDKKGTHQDV